MGPVIKASSHTRGCRVWTYVPYGVRVKAQPGENNTRRVCLIPANGNDPEEMCGRLSIACAELFGNGLSQMADEGEPSIEIDKGVDETLDSSSLLDLGSALDKDPQIPTEDAEAAWEAPIRNLFADPASLSILLWSIESKVPTVGADWVPTREVCSIIREGLNLATVPSWVLRKVIVGLLSRSLLEEVKIAGNQRVSAYRLTRQGLETIELHSGERPRRMDLSSTEASLVVDAKRTSLKALVEEYRARAATYLEAVAELERLDGDRAELESQLREITEKIAAIDTLRSACAAVIADPDLREAVVELEEVKKMLT